MTIQRQYSLPNCKLILEGLSDEVAVSSPNGRPLLSILVNAECRFAGSQQVLSGGRSFFEHLVKAVNAYAQECLSGLRHPQDSPREDGDAVHLEKVEATHLHRLTWEPAAEMNQAKVELKLTTVELFDLIEAVDQFFADSRTLPDLSLQLQPLHRRYARHVKESVVKKSVPAALGMVSLAAAGFAFFFLPIPEVEKPEPTSESEVTETVPGTTEPPVPGAGPTPPTPTSEPTEEPISSPPGEENQEVPTATIPEPAADAETEEIAESPQTSPPTAAEDSQTSVSGTIDGTTLNLLQQDLRQKLENTWESKGQLPENLAYRVSVDQNGSLIGYQPIAGTKPQAAAQTPLPQLLERPTNTETDSQESADSPEPLAQFKVVFTASGEVEVTPVSE